MRAAILREASGHQLVVMGASAHPASVAPDGRFLFGVVAETVASRAKPTVIVVKTRQQLAVATFEELRAAEGTLAAADAYVERSRSLPTSSIGGSRRTPSMPASSGTSRSWSTSRRSWA